MPPIQCRNNFIYLLIKQLSESWLKIALVILPGCEWRRVHRIHNAIAGEIRTRSAKQVLIRLVAKCTAERDPS